MMSCSASAGSGGSIFNIHPVHSHAACHQARASSALLYVGVNRPRAFDETMDIDFDFFQLFSQLISTAVSARDSQSQYIYIKGTQICRDCSGSTRTKTPTDHLIGLQSRSPAKFRLILFPVSSNYPERNPPTTRIQTSGKCSRICFRRVSSIFKVYSSASLFMIR